MTALAPGDIAIDRIVEIEDRRESGESVAPAHFPAPSFGRTVRHGGARRFRVVGEGA